VGERCRCYDLPEPPRRARCKFCGRIAGPPPRHACHAVGCDVAVPPKMLFCLRHWRMVPRELQRRVWRAYVPGQEIRKDPTDEYIEVQREVVAYVARLEGRTP
jgi:hypothetical protein